MRKQATETSRGAARIDETDRKIMRLLQQEGRYTVRELASLVHLTPTPVHERLKRLEAEGYIKGYHARLDTVKVGIGYTVFCTVKLSSINTDILRQFDEFIENVPQVVACYNVAGRWDYILQIMVPDVLSYRTLVIETLGKIPYLGSLESIFVMDTVKSLPGVPL